MTGHRSLPTGNCWGVWTAVAEQELTLPASKAGTQLDLLVEAMGRPEL